MYLGRIVEKADARELYAQPQAPLHRRAAFRRPRARSAPKRIDRIVLSGEVPSPANPPTGCPFHPRCPLTRLAAAEHEKIRAETIKVPFGNSLLSLKVLEFGGTTEIQSGPEKFRVMRKCVAEAPTLERKFSDPQHTAACWLTR